MGIAVGAGALLIGGKKCLKKNSFSLSEREICLFSYFDWLD
jgi:hypothetical protein